MESSLDLLWSYLALNDLESFKATLNDPSINVNDISRNGGTVLHRYMFFKESSLDVSEVINLLVKAGLDIDKAENLRSEGRTALHLAVLVHSFDLCRSLIEQGATIDIQDKYGNTPLWRAVMKYNTTDEVERVKLGRIINLLLSNGADPNFKNYLGHSPLDMAQTHKGTDVIKYFKDYH